MNGGYAQNGQDSTVRGTDRKQGQPFSGSQKRGLRGNAQRVFSRLDATLKAKANDLVVSSGLATRVAGAGVQTRRDPHA